MPHADPNTASQAQRLVNISALKQLQQSNPGLYDPIAVETAALQALGWNNPEQFFLPPDQRNKPTPEAQKAMADAQNDAKNSEARMLDAKTRAEDSATKRQLDMAKANLEQAKANADIQNETNAVQNARMKHLSDERIQLLDVAQDVLKNPEALAVAAPLIEPALQEIMGTGLKPPGFGGA